VGAELARGVRPPWVIICFGVVFASSWLIGLPLILLGARCSSWEHDACTLHSSLLSLAYMLACLNICVPGISSLLEEQGWTSPLPFILPLPLFPSIPFHCSHFLPVFLLPPSSLASPLLHWSGSSNKQGCVFHRLFFYFRLDSMPQCALLEHLIQ